METAPVEKPEATSIVHEQQPSASALPKQPSLANIDEIMSENVTAEVPQTQEPTTPDRTQPPVFNRSMGVESSYDVIQTPKKVRETDCPIAASLLADIVNSTTIASTNTVARYKFKPLKYSDELLQVPQELQIYLFGALSSKYLREV
jgi:hypothetical protein